MADAWRSKLRLQLEDFVDTFVVDGAQPAEVLDALVEQIASMRAAYQHDPDPTDDPGNGIEEPANDWPAADSGT